MIGKHFYQHEYEQKFDGDKNNPRISSATVTNFQLTLASAKENFPILNDLLGPVEPEILTFLIFSSFLSRNQHGAERLLVTTKVGHKTLKSGTYTSAN